MSAERPPAAAAVATASSGPPAATEDSERTTDTVTINEIFVSIQGESTFAGLPCLFLRTTGCPLRCRWCDTEYAFHEGQRRRIDDLVAEACSHAVQLVEITGGEPLAQAGVPLLAAELLQRGKTVLVETSGAIDISVLPAGAITILDMKCPGSGEMQANDYTNLDRLGARDEVKFVIADRADYEWARELVRQHGLDTRVPVLFSPVWDELPPARLAEWIQRDSLPVRLQLQLHKLLWPDIERGV